MFILLHNIFLRLANPTLIFYNSISSELLLCNLPVPLTGFLLEEVGLALSKSSAFNGELGHSGALQNKHKHKIFDNFFKNK